MAIKGTEKDDEMNFLARIYEKKAKKMYRPSRVRYIFSSYKNLKRFESILTEIGSRVESNPPGAGRTTAEPKHAAGLTLRDQPVRWADISRATS